MTVAAWLVLSCAAVAAAQDPLAVGQTVERDLLPGAAHSYTIELRAGDYVAGSIEQKGLAVFAAVFLPDGSRMRGLSGPREGKRDIAFIAETSGIYRLELRGPTPAEMAQSGVPPVDKGTYTLKLAEKLALDDRLKPAPRKDKYLSPAIEALRKQLVRGEKKTDAFWQERAQAGTPLVEPVDTVASSQNPSTWNDTQRTLVTFLWRGTPETRNVVVLGSFAGRPIAETAMTQLEGSDVWY